MTPRALRASFALASGLGWGVMAVLMLFTNQIEAIFGEISGTNPVFILAVYSPAIAAILLVWRHYGTKGLGSFFRREQGGIREASAMLPAAHPSRLRHSRPVSGVDS
jgi:uncharacterized protein